ncbi:MULTISPECIES: GAF domain-containing protein [unclassified Coleofasciculus]|uniref:GAF domain-containing protein n=1 Tax=unclassified Coleofasciculus TaxID=2692782 RepID=UPI001880A66D|nr:MULTISPECIES: GAF domain-containing protein [unclassified Coleofasciculus]MBE9126647.1 GAF domain-containing protein [Coleofasciculus sp. LEGE 07081]MBE9148489.1 GAF domain-containing protein [Coleofasciculus sp. LEGE 07092]
MAKHQDLDVILTEILKEIAQGFKRIIGTDRTTIFLLDQQNLECCLIFCSDSPHLIEMRIPVQPGLDQVASLEKIVGKPFDVYKLSPASCKKYLKSSTSYITYNLLALPISNSQGYSIAFVQFLNKLNPETNSEYLLSKRVDLNGFTQQDEKRFAKAVASMRKTIERCQSLYTEIKKQRAVVAFIKAIHAISQGGLDLDATLTLVVDETKELMNAALTRLWLIDRERNQLCTKILIADGSFQELHLSIGVGFVGQVAKSGKPINVPFDFYIHPDSDRMKQWDRQNHYRTCSLLCLPVFSPGGELLGVIELVNKKKQGHFPDYDPDNWPVPPEGFKASFSQADQQLMGAFSLQVGIALQNAKLFTTLKQQEQIQRHIFRNLDNGAIYTDLEGRVITLNEKGKQLLNSSKDKSLEGCWIWDLIQLKDSDFIEWFQEALSGNHQQYHSKQELMATDRQYPIDLSINAIADSSNANNILGFLVGLQEVSEDKNSKRNSYRQISQELTQELLKGLESKSSPQKDISILCSDIRGYTNLIADMDAQKVVATLNQYFELMVEVVFKYQGTLDKYIGDALLAIFETSLSPNGQAWLAIQTAVEMRQRLTEFNTKHFPKKQYCLRMGIGIHADKVTPNPKDSSQSYLSESINFTSMLERANLDYKCDIIISETIYQKCSDRIWARELDCIHVKEKNQPAAIYELIGLRSESISQQQQQLIEHHHQGRQYYLERQFALAMRKFSQVLEIDNSDRAARLHIQRCLHWLESPPPENWDGVWTN